MASTSQCPYCGSILRSDQQSCPNCGAANEAYVTASPRTITHPKTIEELKQYCAERGMPLQRMRFYIGEDFRSPKAFGIYQDGETFIVYKNKADGSRAVRYKGRNEARAVNELFQKLLEECHNRGIYPDGEPATRDRGGSGQKQTKKSSGGLPTVMAVFVILFIVNVVLFLFGALFSGCAHRQDGYYSSGGGTVYYRYGDDWYYTYDDNDAGFWYETDSFPESNYQEYSLGEDWDSDWGVSDFKESSTWDEIEEWESSSSSGSDYDSWDSSDYDSWDSGGTDWDSDW